MLQNWLKRKPATPTEEPAPKRQKTEEAPVKSTTSDLPQFDVRFEVVNSTDELLMGVEGKKAEPIEISDSQEEEDVKSMIEDKRRKAAEIRRQKQAEKAAKVSLSELLNFDPTTLDTLEDFVETFNKIAEKILNDTEIVAKNKRYRIVEIEFYLVGGVHDDIFTHQDKQQLTSCQWYFHRTGNQYRSGNYKGLDITFGKDCYGGILIRGLEDISTGKLYDGPCISVNQLLASVGLSEVTEIVKSADFKWDAFDDANSIYLRDPKQPLPRRNYLKCPRVGLSLKRRNGPRTLFLGKDYRYLTLPKDIKKGKVNMALGLFKQAKDVPTIHHTIGSSVPVIKGWHEGYITGFKNPDFEKFMGSDFQQQQSFCEFMGVWKALHDQPEEKKEKA